MLEFPMKGPSHLVHCFKKLYLSSESLIYLDNFVQKSNRYRKRFFKK